MDFLANPIINILIIYILYITYLYVERNWNTKVLPVFCSVWSCPLTAGPRIYQLPTCLSVSILPTWPIEAVQGDQAMQRKEFVKLTELGQQFISVQFGHSVVSDSLRPHEPQHARPPCPSPTPGVYPKSCPLSRWCHPTISSSVVPFSSLPSIFPSLRVFSNEPALRMRWPKYWSFSFSIIPSKEQQFIILSTDTFEIPTA